MIKSKFCILLPVEITPRELNYKILIAIKLAEKGYKCYLGNKSEIWRLFDRLKNFAYLDKGYHENFSKQKIYEKVVERNGLLFNLDEEGGVDFSGSPTILRRYSQNVFKYMEKVFLWGEDQRLLLKKNNLFYNDEKVVVSGHPRFQLLSNPYRRIYQKEIKPKVDKYGKFILFNSNSKYSNHLRGEDFLISNYGKRIENINERIEYDKEKLKHNIELIKEINDKLDYNIIIRPHPEENIDFYKKLFKNNQKIFSIYDQDVIPWLLSCKFMIHNDCTTAIEYFISGKEPIAFNHKLEKKLSARDPISISRNFSDISELISFIKKGEKISENFDYKKINRKFSKDLDSFHIIVEEIDKGIKKKYQTSIETKTFINFNNNFLNFFRLIKTYFFLNKADKLIKNKTKGLSDSEYVFNMFNKILKISNTRLVKIKNHGSGLYSIYSK